MGLGSSPIEAVERALTAIDARDADILAWTYLDRDLARRSAAQVPQEGPLSGFTIGVKDIFDTSDQPTEYGTPIYAGHRPRADAATVSRMRSAGGVILGKTVTTELAWVSPGKTKNPHNGDHTPGGSSSGSAAAVAAGMVDLALGTQTAGSVVRPGSFCGVWALKATYGLLATAGVKQEAPSLDTVGLFARDLDVIELALDAIVGAPSAMAAADHVALMRTDMWDRAMPDCRAIVEHAAEVLGADERTIPDEFVGLATESATIHLFEGCRSYSWEYENHHELLSAELIGILDRAWKIGRSDYAMAAQRMRAARSNEALDRLFGAADVLVTPSAVGEAPITLSSTGDPSFNRLWTALGCPALNVPGFVGGSGLPIGVQLVARPYHESALFHIGRKLAAAAAQGI